MKDLLGYIGVFGGIVIVATIAFALLIGALVSGELAREDSFRQQCIQQDGHLYGTGLTLCLSSDNRIIEVYP